MPLGTFSKLPRESLRALYYKLGGTDDISDLRTRRALLKKIYEAMGNDSADLDNMHRANSVLQKISEVASVGGKYVGVDISDAQLSDPTSQSSVTNPLILSSRATAEINAILSAGKVPIVELAPNIPGLEVVPNYGILTGMNLGETGWAAQIEFFTPSSVGGASMGESMYCQSSDYTERAVNPGNPGGGGHYY